MAAGSAAAATVLTPPPGMAASTNELCTLIDISKCIGCEECVYACREVNADKYPSPRGEIPKMVPQSRVKIADWSSEEKREVTDRLTPYNWLFIQYAEGEYNGEEFELTIPRRCMHCRNAPCVNLCPFGAAFKQDDGIIRIHPDVCMGGAKCKAVCPWKIPERQSGVGLHLELLPQYAGNGVMYKCDRCYQRIDQGELPACIESCPEDVQQIGPRVDIVAKAHQLAQEINGFVYGETENGGTNTLYVSPVPFDVLQKSIEIGPGEPHFKKAADAMEDANNLAKALLIAPVAGIVGGALRLMKQAHSTK